MSRIVQPGATLGVLGSGQLGRMFAIAARRLGYRVAVFSPDDDTPTGQVADIEVQAAYDDLDAVTRFASQVEVVTFEFENVLVETIDAVEKLAPVRPAGQVLHTTQHRLREKSFLRSAGIPVTPFTAVHELADLEGAVDACLPGVLKTAAWGYDGKGQAKVDSHQAAVEAWDAMSRQPAILERHVDFEAELSVVGVRGADGHFVSYGPIANLHRNHILDVSTAPGGFPAEVEREAVEIARAILEQLQVVGVLCVEFFLAADGKLLVNELAPRPHNSGHLTIDAHIACQFEQQVRAVCRLPLAATTQLCPAAMVNLLGDLWSEGEPVWSQALETPEAKLHLYGKQDARPGRKMGHLTVLADSAEQAAEKALATRAKLQTAAPTESEGTSSTVDSSNAETASKD